MSNQHTEEISKGAALAERLANINHQTEAGMETSAAASEAQTAMRKWKGMVQSEEKQWKKNKAGDQARIENIQRIENELQKDIGNYNSFVEFNERTGNQIANLNLQLKGLTLIDILLGIAVGVAVLKAMNISKS